jgi:hypothetical protein
MSILELICLGLLGAVAWYWFDSLKTREICIAIARRACAAEDLQFLDESVTCESVWPVRRGEDGQFRLRRVYGFEYSDTGNNRRKGSVTVLGHAVVAVYILPRLV